MRAGKIFAILKESASEWIKDNAPTLGAALAYYTVFSMGPLLIIVIGIAGIVFGQQAARGEIEQQMSQLLGAKGAQAIQTVIQGASKPRHGVMATVIGGVTLLITASGALSQLQSSLNAIWNVRDRSSGGVWSVVRKRLLSLGVILIAGFLLLASIMASTAVSVASHWLGSVVPSMGMLGHVANLAISFCIITLLFALIFKYLPDATVAWGDVWIGALFTALLFTAGNFVVGLYLGKTAFGSAYGAAGSLLVLLLWVYYSAQILFFGAEFTKVYARHLGSKCKEAE